VSVDEEDSTFVSKEGSKLTGQGPEVRKIGVHDEDEAAMWVTGGRLLDGMAAEIYVMPFPEMLVETMLGATRMDMSGAWAARM
jgi:hypothetical protein